MIYLLHQFGADSDTKSLGLNGFLIHFLLVVVWEAYSIFIFEKKHVERLICIPLGDEYVICFKNILHQIIFSYFSVVSAQNNIILVDQSV